MGLRALLATLIVASTAAFVVGTTLERNHHTESAATLKSEGAAASATERHASTAARSTAPTSALSKRPKTTTAAANPGAHAGESAAHRKAEGLPPETTTG